MNNFFDLENLLLWQYNNSFDIKSKAESKATGCMAAIALILGVLAALRAEAISNGYAIYSKLSFAAFLLGIICIILFAIVLLPQNLKVFNFDKLKDFIQWSKESNNGRIKTLKEDFEEMIRKNDKKAKILINYTNIISWGTFFLSIIFAFAIVTFFIGI